MKKVRNMDAENRDEFARVVRKSADQRRSAAGKCGDVADQVDGDDDER